MSDTGPCRPAALFIAIAWLLLKRRIRHTTERCRTRNRLINLNSCHAVRRRNPPQVWGRPAALIGKLLAASPVKVLFLSNIEGAIVTTETMLNVKRSAASMLREKVEKIAVVGVTGVKKVFFDAFVKALGKTNARSFRTEKEALDWLVE